jgi:hypothetical protein
VAPAQADAVAEVGSRGHGRYMLGDLPARRQDAVAAPMRPLLAVPGEANEAAQPMRAATATRARSLAGS